MKKLCFQNVLIFWKFAAISQVPCLEEKFLEFAAYHYIQVAKTERFAELPQENIQILLKRNDINADEKTVFLSLMNWINFDKDTRQQCLPHLLHSVRLGLVGKDYFENIVQQNSVIQEGCKDNKSLNMFNKCWCLLLKTKDPVYVKTQTEQTRIR